MRDDGKVPQTEPQAWIVAATSAAVRLAAEAGAEADDILEHAGDASPDRLASQISRLEESAAVAEVATDLAALLWAECEDVPPIATILEEPATQAALEAVAEARRQAAGSLAAVADAAAQRPVREPLLDLPAPLQPISFGAAPSRAPEPPGAPASPLGPMAAEADPAAPEPVLPAVAAALPSSDSARRPAAGAVLAGAAAAAILLFGRRLRRA